MTNCLKRVSRWTSQPRNWSVQADTYQRELNIIKFPLNTSAQSTLFTNAICDNPPPPGGDGAKGPTSHHCVYDRNISLHVDSLHSSQISGSRKIYSDLLLNNLGLGELRWSGDVRTERGRFWADARTSSTGIILIHLREDPIELKRCRNSLVMFY